MKVTIRSVAKLAGVAPSTVSHYLNQSAPVSTDTAQSVERAIAALSYRVNLGARSLRMRKTHSIGLIIPNITTPFFGEIAEIIENALWDKDYQMLLCISERDLEREIVQVENLASRQVDGLLMVYQGEQSKAIRFSKGSSFPIVFVDRPIPGEYSVATDNFDGGQLAARHLAELGHRCIGMMCGEAEIRNVAERIDGFLTELRRWQIEINPEYILHGRQELQFGLRISELLAKQPRPTAIFATNDIVAIGAWLTLLESGCRVPKDMSIIGFDNIEMSRFLSPPLTTVGQATREIAARAVELLLQRVNEGERFANKEHTNVVIPPAIHVRGSTAAMYNEQETAQQAII
jgi:DNA-binding LacI/PurR family transcriptional regulator